MNESQVGLLTIENYASSYLLFEDRQAGVTEVYCPEEERFFYNAYCLETKLLKELFTVECEFLEDALQTANQEFGTWQLKTFDKKSGCGTCVAKK